MCQPLVGEPGLATALIGDTPHAGLYIICYCTEKCTA